MAQLKSGWQNKILWTCTDHFAFPFFHIVKLLSYKKKEYGVFQELCSVTQPSEKISGSGIKIHLAPKFSEMKNAQGTSDGT